MPNFRSAYDEVRHRVAHYDLDDDGNPNPSRTQQHMTQETDINNIIKRFDRTGLLDHVNRAVAAYGDFTEVNEYQEALNLVVRAQDAFDQLPSDVRKRFRFDPGEFFEFATDPGNAEEMVRMGLAEIREPDVLAAAVESLSATIEARLPASTDGTEA